MQTTISIRPSKDLRTQYPTISQLAREHPVAITVNGREDTVILSHEQYLAMQDYIVELEQKNALYAHLAQAEDDVRLGRVYDAEDVFASVLQTVNEA